MLVRIQDFILLVRVCARFYHPKWKAARWLILSGKLAEMKIMVEFLKTQTNKIGLLNAASTTNLTAKQNVFCSLAAVLLLRQTKALVGFHDFLQTVGSMTGTVAVSGSNSLAQFSVLSHVLADVGVVQKGPWTNIRWILRQRSDQITHFHTRISSQEGRGGSSHIGGLERTRSIRCLNSIFHLLVPPILGVTFLPLFATPSHFCPHTRAAD